MNEDITIAADREPFEMCPHWLLCDATVSAQAIRLYLLLRKYANRHGECYPSRQKLAHALGVSLPTLDRARQQLVNAGAVTVQRRQVSGNGWASSLYRVHWNPAGGKESLPGVVKKLDKGGKESCTLTNTQVTNTQEANTLDQSQAAEGQQIVKRPIEATEPETPITIPGEGAKRLKLPYSADFEAFWRTYPRRVGKRAAREAYEQAIQDADPAIILAGAKRYAADPNREAQFTPHPTTWLRQGRWEDDPLPARSKTPTGGTRRMDNYADIHQRINRAKGITAS